MNFFERRRSADELPASLSRWLLTASILALCMLCLGCASIPAATR